VDQGADIIVTPPEGGRPELVVEVKARGDIEAAMGQLKRYMQWVGAPFGLLVVGSTIRLLRETYRESGLESIKTLGDYRTDAIDALRPPDPTAMPHADLEFEARVQDWLESLGDPSYAESLPEDLRAAVREHLAPIIQSGIVRAAGPRARRMISRA